MTPAQPLEQSQSYSGQSVMPVPATSRYCWPVNMISIILSLTLLSRVQAEVYSSTDDMKSVFRLERNIVTQLLHLAETLTAKLNRIQR